MLVLFGLEHFITDVLSQTYYTLNILDFGLVLLEQANFHLCDSRMLLIAIQCIVKYQKTLTSKQRYNKVYKTSSKPMLHGFLEYQTWLKSL